MLSFRLSQSNRRTALRGALSAALALVALGTPFAVEAAPSTYALAHTYTLGGEGGWDYLTYDVAHKHVFISRGTHVMVVDSTTGRLAGEIAGTGGVHGIALAPSLNKGFTSNGRDNSVTVFDLTTLKTTATIPIAGKNPDAILYDPATKRVFTFNGGSNDATAIDAILNTVIGAIALPGRPEFAATGETGIIYANIEDKSEVVAIDATKDVILNTWSLAPCDGPSGLSMDIQHRRLFASCSNKLMAVVDALNGKVVATLPIGQGTDATAFDPGTQLAFSSNGDGTLTVVHEDGPNAFSVVQNATTQPFARTFAVDPSTHTIYLVTADVVIGPPAAGQTRPSRTMRPGSFRLLVLSAP